MLAKHRTIRQALKYVADHPEWPTTPRTEMPIWELVARNLFQISNHPDTRIIGSINKSTKAQAIILNRTTGTRRAGTHPAVRNASQVNLKDLTAGRPEMNDE